MAALMKPTGATRPCAPFGRLAAKAVAQSHERYLQPI